ncbi:thioesterase II family protein [Streptomyces sp. NPDC001530]|uniref:thioesterase II family protein n=1 Tax=Streptomyces sp. NPDC001530 TaxID=3364582 RepID=UPI00368BD097
MTFETSDDVWFRRYPAARTPRVRLVCFPHAGGNAQLFHGWPHRLPGDVDVLAVRYPGRQERMAEPCVESMDELAGSVAGALAGYRDVPLALFGHSMGAAVAYEVATRLENDGDDLLHVFLSARNAPHRAPRTFLHRSADDVLLASVRRLGTLGGDPYGVPELRELLLPVLRSDYRLIETYAPQDPPRLRAPITAYVGAADPGCDVERVAAWAELTVGGFDLRAFPGDHFYLAPKEAELTADIAARLARPPRGLTASAIPAAQPAATTARTAP